MSTHKRLNRQSGIVNLTDLRAYFGHAGGSNSLISYFETGSFRPK